MTDNEVWQELCIKMAVSATALKSLLEKRFGVPPEVTSQILNIAMSDPQCCQAAREIVYEQFADIKQCLTERKRPR